MIIGVFTLRVTKNDMLGNTTNSTNSTSTPAATNATPATNTTPAKPATTVANNTSPNNTSNSSSKPATVYYVPYTYSWNPVYYNPGYYSGWAYDDFYYYPYYDYYPYDFYYGGFYDYGWDAGFGGFDYGFDYGFGDFFRKNKKNMKKKSDNERLDNAKSRLEKIKKVTFNDKSYDTSKIREENKAYSTKWLLEQLRVSRILELEDLIKQRENKK